VAEYLSFARSYALTNLHCDRSCWHKCPEQAQQQQETSSEKSLVNCPPHFQCGWSPSSWRNCWSHRLI